MSFRLQLARNAAAPPKPAAARTSPTTTGMLIKSGTILFLWWLRRRPRLRRLGEGGCLRLGPFARGGGGLIGRPPACERVEGVWGNREVPPPQVLRRGLAGETWFPPRERAEGERQLCRHLLAQEVDDLARRRARREYLRNTLLLQLGGIVGRDRPADDDQHVLRLVGTQAV